MKLSQAILFWLLLAMLITPSLALLPPVPDPNIPICGDVNFFFWNDSCSFGSSYNRLATYPQLQDETLLSTTVSASTGERTIATFVTDSFPNGKVLAPGLTRYRTYLNVSSAVGVTTFDFIPYNVSPSGVTTRMFFGVPRSEEVNELVAREYLTSYSRRNYTYFLPGERLLIRVNASTTSTTPRTAYFSIAGTAQASMVQIGYWGCEGGTYTKIFNTGDKVVINQSFTQDPTGGNSTPWSLWVASGIIGLALIVIALARSKTQRMDYEINIIISVLSWPFCWYFAWGGMTSVDYIVGAGTAATANTTAMITQHILYSFWMLGWIGVGGCIFAAFVTALLISQYNLFRNNETEAEAREQQKKMMNDNQHEKES